MGITVKPFHGVRPKPEYAAAVAALPYDVMNAEEARVMVEGNPHSFLHVDKAEIDLPPDTDPYSQAVYDKAKENLDGLIKDGILVQDGQANLYVYRLTMNGRAQVGLAACVSVEEYEKGLIKKHEFTRKEKEIDRINHMIACNAHTGPIFLAYRADAVSGQATPQALMADWIKDKNPVYDFVADSVRHELWVVDDTEVQKQLEQAFKQIPCLYIADGHHRNATAAKVAEMRNAKTPQPEAEHNFYLGVIFPHDALEIMDYNRIVTDLNGMEPAEFIEELKKIGTVEPSSGPVKPGGKFEFGMYMAGQWYKVIVKSLKSDAIGTLDVSVLQDRILSPLLGINDPRTDNRIDFVGGIRGLKELERRVDSGEMAVAFSMYPTAMEELMNVSDAGQVMPPKSTWFEPKLLSGVLVHLF